MLSRIVLASTLLVAAFIALTACSESGSAGPPPDPGTRPTQTTRPGQRYGRPLIFYAEVDKAGNYFRRMFIDSASAVSVRQTGALPESALLVMETWFGDDQGTVYIRQKQDGAWLSGSFSPGTPAFMVSRDQTCNSCHRRAEITDLTFTKPLLLKALQADRPQTIVCNESSFTPCDLSVYQGD